MKEQNPLRVAALVDLPRSRISGGHLKSWENLVLAASQSNLPLDLTLYASGPHLTEELSAHARIKQLPPIFSTSKLKFLPYIPDNTDLGSYHKELAKELETMDVIHTTDGYFCFAQTAEKVSKKKGIPLTTSFHTDTPTYARVFTKEAIGQIFGTGRLGTLLIDRLKIPEKQEQKKLKRLKAHLHRCNKALYTRQEDRDLAESILGFENVRPMRLGVNRAIVGPHRTDRAGIEADYKIPPKQIIFIFVGRLDVGKNIYTLIEAMENLIAEGQPVHLITAGLGPAENDLRERLGKHVTVAGFIDPEELARLYASVDCLALTSEVEIRSMAAVESMTSGLPILVSQKSGLARLCNFTPAMVEVESGTEAWTNAMRDFVGSINKRVHMHKVALGFAETHIANWIDVLGEDLLITWKQATEQKSKTPTP
ncbi:MAG: glycosyltransferase [Alphaproteobacteria bacterium]|nr:glycosyltransferase [Alphaproteobacteria bacterium]